MQKVIIKLGGSVITHKERFPPAANLASLARLANEVKEGWKASQMSVLLVHGAGCFGHIPAHQYRLTSDQWHEAKREGTVIIREQMTKLNGLVVSTLVEAGLPAINFQPSAGCVLKGKKLVEFPIKPLEEFMRHGLIPVAYGDVSVDLETGIDILSGDQIISYLANWMKPDRIIIGTDVDGVFSKDPNKHSDALLVSEISQNNLETVMQGLGGSTHIDVTGGMAGKIKELWSLASQGMSIHLVNANKEGRMAKSLMGQSCPGTWIHK